MEIRDQGVHHVELAAGKQVQRRGGTLAGEDPSCRLVPSAFQAAHAGGAHGDDAPACRLRALDGIGGAFGHGVELGVHPMVGRVVLVDDSERVDSHFELDGFPTGARVR